jgi:hypothetical protein
VLTDLYALVQIIRNLETTLQREKAARAADGGVAALRLAPGVLTIAAGGLNARPEPHESAVSGGE